MRIFSQMGYSTAETWAARLEGMAKPARMEDIPSLPKNGWMPVGTVEFCLFAMDRQGIQRPEPIDYPPAIWSFEACGHRLGTVADLPSGWSPDKPCGLHVKPWQTKLPHDRWNPDTPVWVANWHRFGPEYRVYVCHGEILGMARYDDWEMDDPDWPDLDLAKIRRMIDLYQDAGAPAGYGLDVGISDQDGQTFLVEVNDGWALGYYPRGTCSAGDYLRLLRERWGELVGNPRHDGLG